MTRTTVSGSFRATRRAPGPERVEHVAHGARCPRRDGAARAPAVTHDCCRPTTARCCCARRGRRWAPVWCCAGAEARGRRVGGGRRGRPGRLAADQTAGRVRPDDRRRGHRTGQRSAAGGRRGQGNHAARRADPGLSGRVPRSRQGGSVCRLGHGGHRGRRPGSWTRAASRRGTSGPDSAGASPKPVPTTTADAERVAPVVPIRRASVTFDITACRTSRSARPCSGRGRTR